MTNKLNHKKGGKAIASGEFGCVFSPSLKCKGSSKRENNKISKLMTEKHAIEEYEEINEIKDKLKDIPNYKDFFLVSDTTICKPAKLSSTDLKNFTKKCSALPKDDITKKNINDKLDKIMALNMPNGGLPVDDYIYDNGDFTKIYNLNKCLINLLLHGIVPMNKKNIYHCDIKDSNILVDDSSKVHIQTRLIDWGLTTQYVPFKNESFPKTWRNRPLQFNVPFSVIIFTDAFVEKYTKFIDDKNKIDHISLKPFVISYIHFWIKERGSGHYKFINEIMYILFGHELTTMDDSGKKTVIENDFTISYITDYIVDILIHFTKFRSDGSLDLREYLDNVFINNVDIWGFGMSYFPLLELLNNSRIKLKSFELEIFENIRKIFIKIFTTRVEVINVDEISKELNNIGNIIEKNIKHNLKNDKSLASGLKIKSKGRRIKGLTGKTHIPKTTKVSFKRVPKSRTRKFKKLFLVSAKIKYNNSV